MATKQEQKRLVKDGNAATIVVHDQLEELACAGAREMLTKALNEELDAYLGRDRYERTDSRRGYRNGTTPRKLTLGSGTIQLAVPRIRDVPDGQEPFESKILRKHQRRSDTLDTAFTNLFIEGLATRDFEPAIRLLAGEDAPLSGRVRGTVYLIHGESSGDSLLNTRNGSGTSLAGSLLN